MKNEKSNKKKVKIIIIVICLCLIYLATKITYTAYESNIEGTVDAKIAKWDISINNEQITTIEEKNISIKDIKWDGTHVAEGKVAPGSTGVMKIQIDPTKTDVAIRYDLEIIDKTINPDVVLKVTSIEQDSLELVKTGKNTYTGIISLNSIQSGIKPTITLNLIWENDQNVNDLDKEITSTDDYLQMNFTASQYKGETIVPYTE